MKPSRWPNPLSNYAPSQCWLPTTDKLKEQFGLLAMHPRDVESMEKEIYELLSDNLTPETAGGDVTDLTASR